MRKIYLFLPLVLLLVACKPSTPLAEPIQQKVEEAIQATRAMETMIATVLTASAQPPGNVATNTPLEPSKTPIPSETPTLTPTATNTPTETLTKTPTKTLAPTSPPATQTTNYLVLDSKCNDPKAECATMDVYNKTGETVTLTFRGGNVNITFSMAADAIHYIIKLQPGRYYYKFVTCGGRSENGYHALNDNWYILFKCW
jgi:hypothetical protein